MGARGHHVALGGGDRPQVAVSARPLLVGDGIVAGRQRREHRLAVLAGRGHGVGPGAAERLQILGVHARRDPRIHLDQAGVVERGAILSELGAGPLPADGAILGRRRGQRRAEQDQRNEAGKRAGHEKVYDRLLRASFISSGVAPCPGRSRGSCRGGRRRDRRPPRTAAASIGLHDVDHGGRRRRRRARRQGRADPRPEAVRLRAPRGRRETAHHLGRADRAWTDAGRGRRKGAATATGRRRPPPAPRPPDAGRGRPRADADRARLPSAVGGRARPGLSGGAQLRRRSDRRRTTSPASSSSTPGWRPCRRSRPIAGRWRTRSRRSPGPRRRTFTRQTPFVSLFGDASPDVSPTASAESVGRPPNESGFQPRPRLSTRRRRGRPSDGCAEMAERMENTYEEMMRDRNGHAETAALTALASSMGSLPGRKTVVFFSEGLSVPAAIEAKFRAVIEAANRANVSFYAVDAKGLKVHSEQAATARGIAAIRGIGDDDPARSRTTTSAGPAPPTSSATSSCCARIRPSRLSMLAKETGGFLIDNTNDLASAFPRIDADRRFHYLLTYTPTNTAMDGSFRRIAVKVKRRDADVRARSGYVAVPALGTIPVLRFESNALSALAATPRPTQIPMRAATFAVPRGGRDDARRAVREGARQRRRLLRRRQPDRLPDALHDPGARRRREGRDRPQGQPAVSPHRPGQGRPRRAAGRHPVLPAADRSIPGATPSSTRSTTS